MILFSKPSITAKEQEYLLHALKHSKLCGDGIYTQKASQKLSELLQINMPLLTTSCSHALDMTALLLDLQEGDEVIVPSYTFVSTANAIMLRGATPVFVEIDPRTFNIAPEAIKQAITPRTKAIYVVHYAGVACDMDRIASIAAEHGLPIIEDAAQAVGAYHKGRALGSLGKMGCYSFHESKNYIMGEGGALVFTDDALRHRAEIIREKGTDRSSFIRGEVDKYTWQAVGSSYLPSDLLAAVLLAQLERFAEIMAKRMHIWNSYHAAFAPLEQAAKLIRPYIPDYAEHNAHLYYVVLPTREERDNFLMQLKEKGIYAVFHYVPLHSSPVGMKLGYTEDSLPVTEEYAGRIARLPLWVDMNELEIQTVIDAVLALLA